MGLHLLGVELAGAHRGTDELFVSIHGGLAQGAAVISHLFLPLFSARLTLTGPHRLGTGMVLGPLHGVLARRDDGDSMALQDGVVARALVIGAILPWYFKHQHCHFPLRKPLMVPISYVFPDSVVIDCGLVFCISQ